MPSFASWTLTSPGQPFSSSCRMNSATRPSRSHRSDADGQAIPCSRFWLTTDTRAFVVVAPAPVSFDPFPLVQPAAARTIVIAATAAARPRHHIRARLLERDHGSSGRFRMTPGTTTVTLRGESIMDLLDQFDRGTQWAGSKIPAATEQARRHDAV